MFTKNNTIINIYTADVSPLEDDALFEKAYQLVSEERKKKTDRMKQKKDKMLSLGAECLLIYACRNFGIDYDNEEILQSEYSKPCFANTPLFFNLSHSESRVMCVMADTEVGCDTEKIGKADIKIAKRFFSEEEYTMLEECETEKEKKNLFYRLWVLKESFMKCTGLGFHIPLDSFSIIPGETVKIKQSVDESRYGFIESETADGYKYAVCVKEPFGIITPPLTEINLNEFLTKE